MNQEKLIDKLLEVMNRLSDMGYSEVGLRL